MELLSWNVNGVRAIIKKGFVDFVQREDPDVICLQETKARQEQVQVGLPGYEQYWYAAERPGYSGTATFTKTTPLSVQYGIGVDEHDKEGRVLTLEFDEYFLVNVYVPNAKPDLSRLEYRQRWDEDFLEFLKGLERHKPVVVCGDMNVAHNEIDLARPKENEGNKGFTKEERAGFQAFLDGGFIDSFRHLYPDEIKYSWWSYFTKARERNVGWRIDYFLISESIKQRLQEARILDDVHGSDHCPVGITLE